MQREWGRGGKGGTIRGETGAEGGFVSGEAVAEGVGRGFVVAAGEDGTVGGDDAAGPETVTGTAAGTVEMVKSILAQAVAAVAGRGGHERVTVLITIELRRLEG